MMRKLAIACLVLVASMAVLYVSLNTIYNKNSAPADAIVDSIRLRTEQYRSDVQAGLFNYDTERSILSTKIQEYESLTQWAIRPHVKARYEEARAEAEATLAGLEHSKAEAAQFQLQAEDAAARAMSEMLENQRRNSAN